MGIGESPEPLEHDLSLRLAAERPVPAPEFRGVLGRLLASADPGYGPRPERLREKVALWLAGGAALLALGALQATGAL
jgi:hypothetical protein